MKVWAVYKAVNHYIKKEFTNEKDAKEFLQKELLIHRTITHRFPIISDIYFSDEEFPEDSKPDPEVLRWLKRANDHYENL